MSRRHVLVRLISYAALLFMYVPVLVVALFAFNSTKSLFRFHSFSLRWFQALIADREMVESIWFSLQIGTVVTALSVAIGTFLAIGAAHLARGPRQAVIAVNGARLLTPEVATAVALILLFTQAGVTLSTTTLIVAQTAFIASFVFIVVYSRISRLNPEAREAAMDLGAGPAKSIWLVVVPQLAPAIVVSAVLSFVLSFDNFVTSFFTSGLGVPPLPIRIYGLLHQRVTPEVNAAGVLMFGVIISLLVVGACAYLLVTRGIRGPRLKIGETVG